MPAIRRKASSRSSKEVAEGPYPCSQCDALIARKTDLKRHEKIHSNDAKFSCPEQGCKFSTRQKSNLTTHMAQHNPGLKTQCPDCSFECNDKSSLIKHRKCKHGYVPSQQRAPGPSKRDLKFLPPVMPTEAGNSSTLEERPARRSEAIVRRFNESYPSSAYDRPRHVCSAFPEHAGNAIWSGSHPAMTTPSPTPPPPPSTLVGYTEHELPLETLQYPLVKRPSLVEGFSHHERSWQSFHPGTQNVLAANALPMSAVAPVMSMGFAVNSGMAVGINPGMGGIPVMQGMSSNFGYLMPVALVPAQFTSSVNEGYMSAQYYPSEPDEGYSSPERRMPSQFYVAEERHVSFDVDGRYY
ncbi:hypothetical protein EV360DRAFT_84365 [Lentinula raphanica]|nr:hypothetical protein EV360DRAFT_84365 [Lentinula raphanica]